MASENLNQNVVTTEAKQENKKSKGFWPKFGNFLAMGGFLLILIVVVVIVIAISMIFK
jgi:hypothetical protein